MNTEQARSVLDVSAGTDASAINAAYTQKRASVAAKRDQAPTDALKAKCDDLLAELDEARAVLLAEAARADSATAAEPAGEASGPASAPDMDPALDKARSALGVGADADASSIEAAHAHKRSLLEKKRAQAPTDALKTKFDGLLSQLDEAKALLLGASGGGSGSASRPAEKPAAASSARGTPLSQTKMADLPSARASATRIDDSTAGAAVELEAGAVLANRYEIRDRIGAGGMGAVYHAIDRTRNEDVALKVLLPAMVGNARARERFLDEARLSSKLSHPGIVNVYDVQGDGDYVFLSMELLEGQDLRSLIETRKLARQAFDEGEAKALARSLCEALAYAHQHTVHRDIKPENVWVTEDGEYKLMDFGIARVMSNSARTQTGMAMGTAYYMAPEQLKGTGKVDGRADQYALAVLLYELLTGDVPAGRIKPLREKRKDLGRGFAAAIDKALEPDPEERHADMTAFAAALSQKGGGFSAGAVLPGKKAAIAAAAVLVLVLGGFGLVSAAGSGGIGAMLANLLPMSEEERRALQADAVRLQGQVNTLARRLENARRNLDSDLRDAERNNSDELPRLQRWHEAVERNLFSGSLMSELEGERAVAEALLRDREYKPAEASFEKAREGYEKALAEFRAGEDLYAADRTALKAKSDWQAYKKKYGVTGQSPSEKQAKQQYSEAQQQERIGELNASLAEYRQAKASWESASGDSVVADQVKKKKAQWAAAIAERQRKAAAAEVERQRKAAAAEAQRKRKELERKAAEARKTIVDTLNGLPNRTDVVEYDDPDIRYRSTKYESDLSIRAKAENCSFRISVSEDRFDTSRTHSSTRTFVEGRGTYQKDAHLEVNVENVMYVDIYSEKAAYREGVKVLGLNLQDAKGNRLLNVKTYSKPSYSSGEPSEYTEPYLEFEFYGSRTDFDYKARQLSESFVTWANWCKSR